LSNHFFAFNAFSIFLFSSKAVVDTQFILPLRM
jgi:hypothetical protein